MLAVTWLYLARAAALVRPHGREFESSSLAHIANEHAQQDDFDIIAPAENLKKLLKVHLPCMAIGPVWFLFTD